jgi:hypothetical protein
MSTTLRVRSDFLNRVSLYLGGVGLIPVLLVVLIATIGVIEPRFYSTANLLPTMAAMHHTQPPVRTVSGPSRPPQMGFMLSAI